MYQEKTKINIDFPTEYIGLVIDQDNILASPVARAWSEELQPQFISDDNLPEQYPEDWKRAFEKYEIKNLLAHGLLDIAGRRTSYFCFASLEDVNVQGVIHKMEMLIPHLHVAVTKFIDVKTNDIYIKTLLTKREKDILQLVYEGGYNSQIGQALSISEYTVKNHVRKILNKLGAANRTHAVAKAIDLGIIAIQ